MRIRRYAALASFVLAACAHPGAAPSKDSELRVMSWNIQAGGKGLDSIAAVIRALNPDIVGLQEVDVHWSDRSAFADQATELGARLGMRALFAPIYSLPPAEVGKPRREFGVAILTRLPVRSSRNDTLTRLSTQVANAPPAPAPGFLEAGVQVGNEKVRVFSTHLDYRADPAIRRTQVAEMLAIIDRETTPVILFGDMNAGPSAVELSPLFARLHDAWLAGSGDGLSYPAEKPAKRIDYVLTTPEFTAVSATVPSTTASDHRPVIATLRIR